MKIGQVDTGSYPLQRRHANSHLTNFGNLAFLLSSATYAKNLLRYLKGTMTYGIRYGGKEISSKGLQLIGYSDADWAGEIDTRRSTSGMVFFYNGGPITYRSSTQKSVALSTAESEYLALSDAVKEAVYLKMLLGDLHQTIDEAIIIYEDNQAAEKISKNPVLYTRTKHIDIRHHFIREKVQKNVVAIQGIPTDKQYADIFTKSLGKQLFLCNASQLITPK